MTVLRRLGQSLLDFALPPHCGVCAKGLGEAEAHLCEVCWSQVELARTRCCCRCSAPQEQAACANCAHWPEELEAVVVMGAFAGVLQRAIHGIKFGGLRHLAFGLGQRLGRMTAFAPQLKQVEGVVPLPLHRARQRQRGYNQSLYIARGMAAVLDKPLLEGGLVRRWSAPPQARLGARQRRQNLDGGFALAKGCSLPAQLLLVDDVVSTGATLAAAVRALRQGGAERVLGGVLACPFFSEAAVGIKGDS